MKIRIVRMGGVLMVEWVLVYIMTIVIHYEILFIATRTTSVARRYIAISVARKRIG